MKPMQPTYYVTHPDGSYTLARPQPVLEYACKRLEKAKREPDAWMYTAKGCKARFGDRWPLPIPDAWTETPLYAAPPAAEQQITRKRPWTEQEHYGEDAPVGTTEQDCPHAAPFRYCETCKVSPCPIGLDSLPASVGGAAEPKPLTLDDEKRLYPALFPAKVGEDEQVQRLIEQLRNGELTSDALDKACYQAADLIEFQARQIATLTAERDRAVEALLYLDKQGGLGFEKHLLIKKAIGGIPYPEFCHHADKCRGLSNCPRDPCCCD